MAPSALNSRDEPEDSVWHYIFAFFISIATILGTGILALPVKVSQSGFAPFVTNFAICWIMQGAILIYMIELMQRACLVLQERSAKALQDGESGSHAPRRPDLHILGRLYLNTTGQVIYSICVILHFISILIAYVLSASRSWARVLTVPQHARWVAIPFWTVFTIFVIFFGRRMQPFVAFFTLGKGFLLVFLVAMIGFISDDIDRQYSDDWSAFMHPLLVSTVALGGAMNIVPVIFARVPFTRQAMVKLRASILLGLTVCAILNVLWTYFILRIVPQKSSENENISLERSQSRGEQATVPLADVIKQDYPQYAWASTIVDLFVLVSVTVSYVTMSSGTKHTLDGMIMDLSERYTVISQSPNKYRFGMYALNFGCVLLVALLNPSGFLMIMEVFTSLALNLEAGVFVVIMLFVSNRLTKANYAPIHDAEAASEDASTASKASHIPMPIGLWMRHFSWAVVVYFLIACFYDVVTAIMHWSGQKTK